MEADVTVLGCEADGHRLGLYPVALGKPMRVRKSMATHLSTSQ